MALQCAPAQICGPSNTCQCPDASFTLCSGVCLDALNDTANCGTCGNVVSEFSTSDSRSCKRLPSHRFKGLVLTRACNDSAAQASTVRLGPAYVPALTSVSRT